ncbi:hypothetical protein BASA81_000579 [Batrachochytrium salamandrivorans]|nr:hypothetical protein BASA81_000579 [Batrachochytrium salamandrivorans]
MSEEEDAWEMDFALVRDGINKRGVSSPSELAHYQDQLGELKARLLRMESAVASGKWKKLSGLTKRLGESATVTTTSTSTTQALVLEQNAIMMQQDEQLEDVSRSIYRLTGVAEQIGDTAQQQIGLLDQVDLEADGVHAQVRTDTRKIAEVSASQNTRSLHCTILALVLFFFLLLLIK